MKTERELFEEWIRSVWLVDATWDESKNTYNESRVHCMWSAWCASAQRDGYKLVPVEPSEKMYITGVDKRQSGGNTADVYKAMIGAAP